MTDKENKTPDLLNQDQENQAKISNFMTEQIKQKPLNGRKKNTKGSRKRGQTTSIVK